MSQALSEGLIDPSRKDLDFRANSNRKKTKQYLLLFRPAERGAERKKREDYF
jgi:hypothetical protein